VQEAEKEAETVQAEVGKLQRNLREAQGRRAAEIVHKRKTISLEINNLRGPILLFSSPLLFFFGLFWRRPFLLSSFAFPPFPRTPSNFIPEQMASQATAASQDPTALLDKLNRLEAAMVLLKGDKKNPVEDQETLLLKKRLEEFEGKLEEVAQKKRLATEEDRGFAMKQQLAAMEKKLQNMERRKSVSLTMVLQQRMMDVESQLRNLRVEEGGQPKNGGRIAELEKKLEELQNTKVTPAMVNDEETNAMRSHVRRLEEGVRLAERRMEEQRLRLEEERMESWRKQQEREEEYKKAQRRREAVLLEKMAQLEKVLAQRAAPSPQAPTGDAALKRRLEELERSFQKSAPAQEQLLVNMEKR
jgi:hypothetical protein